MSEIKIDGGVSLDEPIYVGDTSLAARPFHGRYRWKGSFFLYYIPTVIYPGEVNTEGITLRNRVLSESNMPIFGVSYGETQREVMTLKWVFGDAKDAINFIKDQIDFE